MSLHQPNLVDPFITLELESHLYSLIDECNAVEKILNKAIPQELLRTPSGDPIPNTFWGGILLNVIVTRATIRSQLAPRT